MAEQPDNPPIDPRLLQWMEDRNRFAEQNEDGVDLSLIQSMLEITPIERIRMGHRHRLQTLRLLEIGRRNRQNAVRTNPRPAR